MLIRLLMGLLLAASVAGCSGGEILESNVPLPVRVGGVELISMSSPRALHTATAMRDGRVLICGGTYNAQIGGVLSSAELYDPAAGTFLPTSSMSAARQGHTATLLPNGQVLIAGGSQSVGFRSELASAELYDPQSGTFRRTGSMHTPREGHTATLLRDGRVLITGGSPNGITTTDSAEIYDPSSGLFTAIAPMTVPREAHTATLLKSGKVLIAGGGRGGMPGGYIAYDTAEIFDPTLGTFSALAARMTADRVSHAAAPLEDGRVLLAGGKSGKILMGGFEHSLFWLAPLESAEVYDPESNRFRAVAPMTKSHYLGVATPLPDGDVLISGGWNLKGPVIVGRATAELFHPADNSFYAAPRLHVPRLEQTATLLANGQVLIAGGLDGDSNVTASVEFYAPKERRFIVRPLQKYERHHPMETE
jgi:hypothetical protein